MVSVPFDITVTSEGGWTFASDVECKAVGTRGGRVTEVYVRGLRRNVLGKLEHRWVEVIEGYPYTDPVLLMLAKLAWAKARSEAVADDLRAAWWHDGKQVEAYA